MTHRHRLILTLVVAAGLAMPAAVLATMGHHQGRLDWVSWGIESLCAWGAALCLLASGSGVKPGSLRGSGITAACMLAAWAPLTATAAPHPPSASGAFLAIALAAAVAGRSRGVLSSAGVVLLSVLACSLDATAVLWPIGLAWSAWAMGRYRFIATAALALSLLAVIAGVASDRSSLGSARLIGGGYALHRDMMALLPVVALGLVPFMRMRTGRPRGSCWWLWGWTSASLVGLLAVTASLPLQARLVVLPLWWLLPRGLEDLRRLARAPGPYSSAEKTSSRGAQPPRALATSATLNRVVAILSALVLIGLATPAFRLWSDSLLLTLATFMGWA